MEPDTLKPCLITDTEEGLNPAHIPEYMKGCRRFRIEYRDPSSGFSNWEGTVYLNGDDPDIYDKTAAICKIIAESFGTRSF